MSLGVATGGEVTFGKHCLKTCSNALGIIVLASGEPELYAVVEAGSHGLGINNYWCNYEHK